MPDIKISALTAKTTLVGTEETVVVDGATNKRVTADSIAARAVTGGIAAAATHNHAASEITSGTLALARLPVAASGVSSATDVVRADDSRLSDARTPASHTHTTTDVTDITAAGVSIVTAANAAAQRTALGLGTAATANSTAFAAASHAHTVSDITATGTADGTTFLRGDGAWAVPAGGGGSGTVTSVALSGGTTGITVSGSPITSSGTITLGGTLGITNGGTGATSASAARTALGLGTAAVENTGFFAAASHTHVQSDITGLTTDLSNKAATGAVGSSGLTMNTSKLLGRSTASAGAIEEITVGSGLALSGGTLSTSGGGGGGLLNNSSTSDPTVNDDTGDGYSVGSMWFNTTTGTTFVALDVSSGAAVWNPLGAVDHPGYLSGYYYTPPVNTTSAQACTALRLYASPMPVLFRSTAVGIALRITTLVAGDLRVGIYSNVNARPGVRLAQSAVTAQAAGLNIVALSATLNPGFYWLAVAFSTASSAQSWQTTSHAGGGAGFYYGGLSSGGSSQIFGTASTDNQLYRTAALANLTSDLPSPFDTGSSITKDSAAGAPVLGIAF